MDAKVRSLSFKICKRKQNKFHFDSKTFDLFFDKEIDEARKMKKTQGIQDIKFFLLSPITDLLDMEVRSLRDLRMQVRAVIL